MSTFIHLLATVVKDDYFSVFCFSFFFFFYALQVPLNQLNPINMGTMSVASSLMAAVCAVSFVSVSSIKTRGPVHNYSLLSLFDEALRQQNKLSDLKLTLLRYCLHDVK